MELFLLCSLILVILFIPIYLLLFFYSHRANVSHPNLPPGKMGFPIIGESLEFLSTGRQGHPEKFIYDRITKYSSQVFKTCILGQPTAVLCGAAGNKFLFSNENKLVKSWWPTSVNKIFPYSSQTSSNEESKRMRNLLHNFIKPEVLQRYVGIMDTVAQRHLEDYWEGKHQVTVTPLAKMYTFCVACKVFLNIEDPKHVAKLMHTFNDLASGIISIPIDLPGTSFNRAIKASEWIRKELISIIKHRKVDLAESKAFPKQDILSHMLLTADEDGQYMKETDIANKILGLLVGSHDTTSAAITFIIKNLAELPHIYQEVLKEQMDIAKSKLPGELLNWDDIQKMKYSWNVACEVLRLTPPLQGAFREAISNFNFGGFNIPKSWKLYWSASSTHRNPQCFQEPEKFDPTRFDGAGAAPYTFVPFGGGPRMCPGKEYARLEMLVFMHNLVKGFRWEKLLPNEKIIIDPMPIPAKGLPIRLFHQNNEHYDISLHD